MASITLHVHDMSRDLYSDLIVPQEESEGAVWKTLKTDSIEIIIFRNDDERDAS